MRRLAIVAIGVVVLLLVVGPVVFYGALAFIERQRTADAEAAFAPIEHLGMRVLSQPVAFHRYCECFVEFPESSRLSDDNVSKLSCLNALPREYGLALCIATPNLSDRSLPVLKSIETLDVLDVTQTSISDRGIEELRRALPHCTVVERKGRDPPTMPGP